MRAASSSYIWQQPGWPALAYDAGAIHADLQNAHLTRSFVAGRLSAIGLEEGRRLAAESWAQEAVATAAIEDERLDLDAARSSICRRLGLEGTHRSRVPRQVEGLLDVMEDALGSAGAALTDARLRSWQQSLFPTGFSGLNRVLVEAYRTGPEPMRIVSGPIGRERVHYEAPPSRAVAREMKRFLSWFNARTEPDALVRAALAHLWFETIHPFEDGNGRVGRAVIDMTLAHDVVPLGRMVRISQQLKDNRSEYYDELQRAQCGGLDVTRWILWFVAQMTAACEKAVRAVDSTLAKARFWATNADKDLNARQRKVVNGLLDAGPRGFEGGLNTRKYEAMTATSRATASRELIELAKLGLLASTGAGRSTRYHVNLEGWTPATFG